MRQGSAQYGDVFSKASIDPETAALNETIVARLTGKPDLWCTPASVVRDLRNQGIGLFPLSPKSPRARNITIAGPVGPLTLRIIAPDEPKGAYLHFHGGGWMLGAADHQDDKLERIADRAGMACVSVEYRLAPEHPYPAAPDDCEAAALWLTQEGKNLFGTDRFAIGGESAGAHLSVVTLLRLRDRHGIMPFRAANLFAGMYDLSMTPSVRRWGGEKLVLNTRDLFLFVQGFLRQSGDTRDPDVSPLYADLTGLPPALFSVGTRDLLLDDSMFMSGRWAAAGSHSELALWPGGAHVFTSMPGELTEKALSRIEAFLAEM